MFKTRMRQLGQGMTEYIIIVALIAIAAITAYSFFGQTLRSQTGAIATELGGQNATSVITDAQNNAASAVGEGQSSKKLGNYTNQ